MKISIFLHVSSELQLHQIQSTVASTKFQGLLYSSSLSNRFLTKNEIFSNIPLQKISFLRYFDDIVTKRTYFLKLITYSESPWSFLSPSIYSFSFVLIYYHKN
jgi:hypothetical protein